MGAQASEHDAAESQHLGMTLAATESAINTDRRTRCTICYSRCCSLISHRLQAISILRRVARSEEKKRLLTSKVKKKAQSATTESVKRVIESSPTVLCAPIKRANRIDHFISFPIEDANQTTVKLFHSFFASQGNSLLQSRRDLSFDSGHWPYLLPTACQNPALAMSCVAMSATFHGTQTQDLTSPSHDLLGHYTRAFEELRKMIEVERLVMISEANVMAAINLCMCCGISFGDSSAAIVHWQGILALLDEPCPVMHSGAIINFINHIEHWLVLTADYSPRSEVWPVLVHQEKPPIRKYGRSLEDLITRYVPSPLALWQKLLELCVNPCMATELLESQAAEAGSRKSSIPSPYYTYLRNAVAEQGAILHSKLRHAKDLAKYISLTPPLRVLYTGLKEALPTYKPDGASSCAQRNIRHDNEGSGDDDRLEQNLYTWMLMICACAAKICHDQSALRSLEANVNEVCTRYMNQYNAGWESALVRDLGKLIWSDTFLTGHLRTTWNES